MSLLTNAYLKWLWVSKTYSFLWAHKPLCSHYEKDTISIGKIFLCRSCFFAYLGVVLVPLLIVMLQVSASILISSLTALLLITLSLSHPTIYHKFHRAYRDVLRFNLGGVIGLSLVLLIHEHEIFYPLFVGILLLAFGKFYYQKRKVRKIQFCEECNEYEGDSICSGYILQARLIREYEQEATDYLYNNHYIPSVLGGKQIKR